LASAPRFLDRKYSKRLPKNWSATSLKANVGPWNSSRIFVEPTFLTGVTSVEEEEEEEGEEGEEGW